MRNSLIITVTALLISTNIGCKSNDKTTPPVVNAASATVELPHTPEDVVKIWESQISQNQFALAKLISTGKTLETVVSLDSTNNIKTIPPSTTKILSISCRTEGDKSQCDCLLEDEIGQLKCVYFLVRQNNQWLLQDASSEPVDAPVEKVNKVNKKPEHNPVK